MFHPLIITAMKFTEHDEKVMEKFASMIISRMEQMKNGTWKKGWIGSEVTGEPLSISARSYAGINVLMLLIDTAMRGFEYPIYCTLKQANLLGGHINKGASSMPVIFWKLEVKNPSGHSISADEYHHLSQAEKLRCTVYPFLKSYNVFNIDQTNLREVCHEKIDELSKMFAPEPMEDTRGMYANAAIDKMLKEQSWICPISYTKSSGVAAYSPTKDKIVVPHKGQFKVHTTAEEIYIDGQEFYTTLLHEMIHSTGTESRLNRTTGHRFGDKLYAKEELVAELGAARCGQALGFDARILDNNAAYLDGWMKALKEEPKYVLTLLGDVDKASRMILNKLAA
jgi:antirestriction protein ArdC